MSKTILALDLATTTGWAVGKLGHRCIYGSIRLSPKGTPRAVLFSEALNWFEYLLKKYQPEYVVFESPIPTFGKTNFNTTRILFGLAALIEALSYKAKILKISDVSVVTIRKNLLGQTFKGKEAKLQSLKFTKSYGYKPQDDNASDAIMLWLYFTKLLRSQDAE